MTIITFHTTELETDTYLVLNGARAFVVDPGADADKIAAAANNAGAVIENVLLTHAHFDHIGAAAELQRRGALIVMHRDDVPLVASFKNLAFYTGKTVDKFVPDVTVSGGGDIRQGHPHPRTHRGGSVLCGGGQHFFGGYAV